jgi:hypothetical protein
MTLKNGLNQSGLTTAYKDLTIKAICQVIKVISNKGR